jgi:hypothetical protein
MKRKEWKRETARDFLALGSLVFYVLVLARAFIRPYRPFVDWLMVAGLVLILVGLFYKEFDGYVARGLVLVVFTSLFYGDLLYTGFAVLAGVGIVWSSKLGGKEWWEIIIGLVVGGLGVLVGWFGVGLFF